MTRNTFLPTLTNRRRTQRFRRQPLTPGRADLYELLNRLLAVARTGGAHVEFVALLTDLTTACRLQPKAGEWLAAWLDRMTTRRRDT